MPRPQKNVLIVDDEPLVRQSLAHVFSTLGYSVQSAEDGFSALAAIRQQTPDLIVSDLHMPGMSGFEFLSVVRRRFPAIYVVAITGDLTYSLQRGVVADRFHQKGADMGLLLSSLESLIMDESTASLSRLHAPIWVAYCLPGSGGQAYVLLTCPECLRTFQEVSDRTLGVIRQAVCLYCGGEIPYAIVRPPSRRSFPPLPVGGWH